MDAAVAGLVGAVVGGVLGASAVIVSAWLQQLGQSRRDRLKSAAELGLADFAFTADRAKAAGAGLPPLSVFVAYHSDVLEALSKGALDAAAIARIDRAQVALLQAIKDRPSGKQIREGEK